MRHAKKFPKKLLSRNGEALEGNGKVIQNPHPAPDQRQKLNTSRGSLRARAYYVRELLTDKQ